MSNRLPAGYDVLEPFVDQWAVAGTANRARCRDESTPAQREAFFETAKALLPQALALLDAKPLADHDAQERCLMNLLMSFAHVTMAIEIFGDGEARHAQFRQVMRITRSPADA